MVRPGISRAVVMGVIGFLVGGLVVIVVRSLQGMEQFWDPGVGLVFGTFFAAGFFLWGIGAFDPRLSAHGEPHDEAHDEAHALVPAQAPAADVPPRALFGGAFWQVAAILLVMIVALAAFAMLGPTLTTVGNALGDTRAVGMFPFTLGGRDIVISELVVFAAFILLMLVSLAAVAWVMSLAVTYLTRGAAEARGGTAALPAPAAPARPEGARDAIVFLITFLVIFVVLYLLFYYVLIGLVLPNPPQLLTFLSLVNALLITILILRPRWIVTIVARLSGWLAHVLRGGNRVDGTAKIDRRNRP